MSFILTVYFASGDHVRVTCRYPELVIMYMEHLHGEAVTGWDACAA